MHLVHIAMATWNLLTSKKWGVIQKSQQSCAFVAQIECLLLGLLVHEASQLCYLVLQLVLQLA